MVHLKELEEEVKWLRSKWTANQSNMSLQPTIGDVTHQINDTEQPEHSKGRLIVRVKRSRYADDEASVPSRG